MKIKHFLFAIFFIPLFFSCSEDNDITTPRNLQEYIETFSDSDFGNVIACAASEGASQSYIFYYPETGATDIRYYEASSLSDDPTDFSNYRRKELTTQDVFGGKLQRFSRNDETENWCLVTYLLNGKLHKSNVIRLKNATNETVYTDDVTIEYPTTLAPKFTWTDQGITDNDIYFQVIYETEEDEFISGTYTNDQTFTYFDDINIVNNINVPETPSDLEKDVEYLFTMMAVSEDNWVNLVIQKEFVLGNLEEYLESSNVNTLDNITSFAASADGNDDLSYIYFYPETDARDFRYYETENTDASLDINDLTNYRRKMLTTESDFGAKFRKFSRTGANESWYIITYEINEVVYKTEPIQLQNSSQPTIWESEISIDFSQTLIPIFTWSEFGITNNTNYLHLVTDKDGIFISGIYTEENAFTYNDFSNISSNISTEASPDLVLEDQYNSTLISLNTGNWVNLVIEKSFEVE